MICIRSKFLRRSSYRISLNVTTDGMEVTTDIMEVTTDFLEVALIEVTTAVMEGYVNSDRKIWHGASTHRQLFPNIVL